MPGSGGRSEEGPHGTTAAVAAGLSRRGDTYVYNWRDASGQVFRRKAGTTIDEAIAFKTRIDAELNAGVFVPGSRVTFAEYAAHWIETHPLKEQTRYRYRSILNAHLLPYFGANQLVKITPPSCREWLARQSKTDLAANTLRQHVAVLKSVMKAARADGHIVALPTDGLRVPRQVKRRPRVLTAREAFALVEATPEPWRAAVALAAFGGLRLGEVLALTRSDVDLDRRVIHVLATLSEVSGRTPRLMREVPKSDAGMRDVPIVEPLADLLIAHLAGIPSDQQLVFTTALGTLVSKNNSTATSGARLARPRACRRRVSSTSPGSGRLLRRGGFPGLNSKPMLIPDRLDEDRLLPPNALPSISSSMLDMYCSAAASAAALSLACCSGAKCHKSAEYPQYGQYRDGSSDSTPGFSSSSDFCVTSILKK